MKLGVTLSRARRRVTETGSLIDLQTYQSGKERGSPDRTSVSAACRARTSDLPLSVLRRNENLICISDRVAEHEKYPFVGCQDILDQMMESITKGDSVLIIGKPGLGKKTLSLGLARMFAALRGTTDSISSVHHRDVYTLSLGASFWNRPPGEDVTDIQEKIREVFRLVEAAGPEKIVLCVDDIDILSYVDRLVKERLRSDTQMGAEAMRDEGSNDPAFSVENMLRSLLFNKKVVCLCTCIRAAYERMIETDTFYDEKFTKSFRVLHMKEPDIRQSLRIVRAHRMRIEKEYGAVILDEALRAAVSYSNRYISHRVMPDKALELVCEACVAALRAKDVDADDARGQSKDRTFLFQRGKPPTRSDSAVVLRKQFVDDLIMEWCGFSEEQLESSLRKDELDESSDRVEG